MRKKILALLMGIAVMAIGGATLAACAPQSESEKSYYDELYSVYYANAEESGDMPLNYDDWLASIKGDKGETGKSAYEVWQDAGNSGTEAEFIAWLKGEAGIDGVDIERITVEVLNISGDSYTLYRITLTDGTVVSIIDSNTNIAEDNSNIVDMYIVNNSIEVVKPGNTTPKIYLAIEYVDATAECITLDDVEIIGDKPDFTKAGYYDVLFNYKGHYDIVTIAVHDGADSSGTIRLTYFPTSKFLWFSGEDDNSVNLEGLGLSISVTYNNGNATLLTVTENMVSGLATDEDATFVGADEITITAGGNSVNVPIYIVNSTQAEYIASNSCTATLNNDKTTYYAPKNGVPFDGVSNSIVFTTRFGGNNCTFGKLLNVDMLENATNSLLGYDSSEVGSTEYVVKGIALSSNITVVVYDSTNATLQAVLYSGSTVVLPTNTIPKLSLLFIFEVSESNAYEQAALTEAMITNRAAIDFTTVGLKELEITYHGFEYTLGFSMIDPSVDNVRDVFYDRSAGNITYAIGDKTTAEVQKEINDELLNTIIWINYCTPVDGQYEHVMNVTEEMISYSEVDFTEPGMYRVYLTYGKGANAIKIEVGTITIKFDTSVTATTYNYSHYRNITLYSNEAAILSLGEIILAIGTYTQEGNNITFTSGTLTAYYVLSGEAGSQTIAPVTPVGSLEKTYSSASGDATEYVKVYADYVTYGGEALVFVPEGEDVYINYETFTCSRDSIIDGVIEFGFTKLILNEDGTFEIHD